MEVRIFNGMALNDEGPVK